MNFWELCFDCLYFIGTIYAELANAALYLIMMLIVNSFKLEVTLLSELYSMYGLLEIVSYNCIALAIQCRLSTHFLKKGDY